MPPIERLAANGEEFSKLGAEYFREYAISQMEVGRTHLEKAANEIGRLMVRLGQKQVCDAYRRQFSGVGDEHKVAELLCEITVCVSMADISDEFELRPSTTGKKRCDFRAMLAGHYVWGEVKRYEDTWFEKPHLSGRAISMQSYVNARGRAAIPRAEQLREKLDGYAAGRHPNGVPEQFLKNQINLLFIIHRSYGESERDLHDALFGDRESNNGLFMRERWRNVSACCWSGVDGNDSFTIRKIWGNPNALMAVPENVLTELRQAAVNP